jgi:cation diffusion facilitator CzcD-associated flavoprotein CzcO
MTDSEVVVIGAGPAGLASAAELGRRGVRALVLERSDAVASSWRTRYDRLRLNSSRPFAKLPGSRYTRGTPIFPSRDQFVGYLEGYAQRHAVDVRLGVEVNRIDRDGEGWIVRTSQSDVPAQDVVVASGYTHTPFIPAWPGREGFLGALLHAADYRDPAPFRGQDVLVVGPGSSGMEIAHDLLEGGAGRVRLSARTAPNIILRLPPGPLFANLLMKLPAHRADAVIRFVSRREIGDLSEYGLPVPEEGVFSRLRRLGVAPAIVDHDVIDAIRERRIEIVGGVESLDERGVTLAGNERIEPDALVAATGYRCGLEPIVGHLGLLDERGVPRVRGEGAEAAPGLRFVGYRPLPAHIGHIGREARRAARAIAAARARSRPRAAAAARPGAGEARAAHGSVH